MKERKIHYCDGRLRYVPVCGTSASLKQKTTVHARVTCRVCWFHILADVAPWARGFLDELRGKGVSIPPGITGSLMPEQEVDLTKWRDHVRAGLDINTATGAALDELCRIPVRPAGMTDEQLRELARRGQLDSVVVPAGAPEPVNGKIKRRSGSLGRTFAQQPGSEKAIRELLAVCAPDYTSIQEVVERSGASTEPIGVQPGQIPKDTGDAG